MNVNIMEIETEIKIVQHMLDSLKQCLFISLSNRRLNESKRILSDIKIVKGELRRIKEKQALGDSEKGEIKDEPIHRSRENVFR